VSAVVIEGFWFEANSSTRHSATLRVVEDLYSLTIDEKRSLQGSIHDLDISDRVGRTSRRLIWPDESLFETFDNDSVDQFVSKTEHVGLRSLTVHRLEHSWRWILASLVATVAFIFSFLQWGLPGAAKHIAYSLPPSAHMSVSDDLLERMDEWVFGDSELTPEKRDEIRTRFEKMVELLPPDDIPLTLHFRYMSGRPNAFALPSGEIVVTDALVELVKHDDELDSVLLHEIAHVRYRHSMRRAIQSSALFVLASLALGDTTAVSEIAATVPAVVLQQGYSRGAESESDEYAFSAMVEMKKDPAHFAGIIMRLTAGAEAPETSAGGEPTTDGSDQNRSPDESGGHNDSEDDSRLELGRRILAYLASHPDSALRARRAMEASRRAGFR